jgi:predicted MPP superfamily phosphohydrolase
VIGVERVAGPVRAAYARIPRRVWTGAAIGLVAVAGILLGTALGGRSTSEIGPFQVQLSVGPSWTGDSELQIPPLGAVELDSHDGPAKLTGRIALLDERRTRALINNPQQIETASAGAADDVRNAIVLVAVRTALAAVAGAALLGLLVFRSWRRAALTGATALGAVVLTVATAAATWNPASIREPRYEGLLTNVPAVIGDAKSIADHYGEYRGELIRIVTNLSRTYANLSALPVYEPDPNTIRVLHVSDLHLNPTSYDVIQAVTDQFRVNIVADTGDITHWGTAVENNYVQRIGKLGVPYVFVRGNHDSVATAAAVASQPNAVVLDDQVREVGGLTFAGIGDPQFSPDKTDGDLLEVEPERIAGTKLADTIAAWNATHDAAAPDGATPSPSPAPSPVPSPSGTPTAAAGGPVDVAMVHNPAAAEPLKDSGPLVLAGHTHIREVRDLDEDTKLMIEGSTGANGFRGIGSKNPSPLRMSLLYFSPSGRLQAYDEITVSGAGQSQVELKRTLVPQPSPPSK